MAAAFSAVACSGGGATRGSSVATTGTAPLVGEPEAQLVLAAGPSAFPAALLARFSQSSGCAVVRVAPDHPSALPDLYESTGDEAGELAGRGLVTSLDLGDVAGSGEIPGRLVDPLRLADGGHAGMPYLWSAQVLVSVRTEPAGGPVDSLRLLFARRFAGEVAIAASPLSLAIPARLFGGADPFALDRDDLRAASDALDAARPAVYASGAELRRTLELGVIHLALAAPADLVGLRVATDRRIPREGTVGAERVLSVSSRAAHPGCARAFLAHVLLPESQATLAAARVQWPVRPICDAVPVLACRRQTIALSKTLGRVALAHAPVIADGVPSRGDWRATWQRLALSAP